MLTVGDCSESEVLRAFVPVLQAHNQQASTASSALITGPGDDAAVLDFSSGLTVVTTDTQTENQDFRLVWPSGAKTTGYDVGFKATTQNLADVASMGATPVSMVVSLSVPPITPLDFVTGLARGLVDACKKLGVNQCTISGGDLGRSSEISVTVTALGITQTPVYRSGAQVGDIVAVAGELGTSAAGFAFLDRPEPLPMEEADVQSCVTAQQRPVMPLHAGVQAAGLATAMMDISDGLVRDAGRIAATSSVGIDLSTQQLAPWITALLPVAVLLSSRPKELATSWVLTGGENHGLLATFSCREDIPECFVPVGICTPYDESVPVTVDGVQYAQKGWDHFE